MKISVIIPVYNAEKYVSKAVESALQLDEVFEVILVEDKSPDNALQICQELAQKYDQVKLFQHPDQENHGAGASRNLGLEKVTGDFIAFLDADDYFLPNRFTAEKELFKNPKTDGVFNAIGTEYLTEKGKEEFLSNINDNYLLTVNYPAEGNEVFRGLLGLTQKIFGSFFTLDALTIRRSSLESSKLRFNEALRLHQDSDFIMKLAHHCHLKSGIIDQPVAIRGMHDDNRITKIVKYSPQYNQRQFLFWNSLYEWSKTLTLEKDASQHIYLQKKAFELSTKKGLSKTVDLLVTILKNPNILRTKYRFTYTHS
ncbi:glycosyltransferase family 2 protein [Chryseobacterium joostei]|uniref:Glycosyl transferase family 2 n=1 Tax=Chryseobacterium joostei TaxID=112234 RepID=A0A1N7I9S7_9FLAO|nr:glycosyltransferase family 2 protein [Chryseobacterium joostei]AZB02337.1 glycosyltransferase family 2 protein [Chryseobacterium joostei]SIS33819.1 Glycosyl transferase family 2 [Chryseobacterium joostei]